MPRRLRQLFLLVGLLLCFDGLIGQTRYYVTATTLNIRDNTATSGKIIGKFTQGESVEILSINDGWGTVLLDSDTGYVCMQYLSSEAPDSTYVTTATTATENQSEPWTDKQKAVFWLCFAVAVAIYAFAIVKVRRGELVVIKGWLDLGLLSFPWIVVMFTLLDGFEIFGFYIMTALYILSGLCLIGSLVLSVTANWGNPFNVVFSLVMKIIVIPIIGLGLFHLISKVLDKHGIDRKGIIIFLILGILIGGLMSFEE